jgi:ankyrin repeat protein
MRLLEKNCKPDVEDLGGSTPLFYACKGLCVEAVRILLQIGKANVQHTNKKKQQPMHLVASNSSRTNGRDSIKIMDLLIKQGADPNAQDVRIQSPFTFMMENNQLTNISLLNFLGDPLGKSLKDNSSKSGHSLQLQSLLPLSKEEKLLASLEGNTDPRNLLNKKGYTPLHYCVLNNNVEGVIFLCQEGVDVCIIDEIDGWTPLALGISKGADEDVIDSLLIHSKANQEALTLYDKNGDTVYHLAVARNQYQMLQLLLRHGESFVSLLHNNPNANGQLPIHLAARDGNDKMASLLLNNLSLSAVQDDFGYLPLHEAVAFGHLETVKVLLSHSQCKDINTKIGCYPHSTPLHIAAANGYLDIVSYLVEHNADILMKNADDITALEIAANDLVKNYLEGTYTFLLNVLIFYFIQIWFTLNLCMRPLLIFQKRIVKAFSSLNINAIKHYTGLPSLSNTS